MKKILIIEDDEMSRDVIADFLNLENYDTITAENGEIGIQKIKESVPDIILCDITLPKKNGYEIYEVIRNNIEYVNIPFIFMTGKSDKKEIREGMMLGVDDYITKPIDIAELLKVIKVQLDKKEKNEEKMIKEVTEKEAIIDYLKNQIKTKNIKLENIKTLLKSIATTDIGLLKFINEILIMNLPQIDIEISNGSYWLESFKDLSEPLATVIADLSMVINLFMMLGIITKDYLNIYDIKGTTFYQIINKIKLSGSLPDEIFEKVLKNLNYENTDNPEIFNF